MNARPQQAPQPGGPSFGLAPSDHISKLQYDLAVEISKLSRQLTRPDIAQELGRQLQQNSQQEHQLRIAPIERPMDSFDRSQDHSSYGDSIDQGHVGHDFGAGDMYSRDYQKPREEAPYEGEYGLPSAAPRRTLFPSTAPTFESQGLLDRLRKMSGSAQTVSIDTYGERRPENRSRYEHAASDLGYGSSSDPGYGDHAGYGGGSRAGFGGSERMAPLLDRDEYPPAELKRPLLPDRGRSEGLLRPSSGLLSRPFEYNSRF